MPAAIQNWFKHRRGGGKVGIKDLNDIHHLYKYRYFDCTNYHIKTILDNEFYYASPSELNDPFDLSNRPLYENGSENDMIKYYENAIYNEYPIFTIGKKDAEFEKVKKEINENPEKFKAELNRKFSEKLSEQGVLSFSEKWNSILMWSHYSNNNTGFAVGINFDVMSNFMISSGLNEFTPFFVEYIKEFISVKPFIDGLTDETMKKYFCSKYELWEYESEVRIIGKNKASKATVFPKNIIDEVYLGLRISDDNKTMIVNALRLKEHKPKLFQIIQKNYSFEFDREEINYK